MKPKTKTSILSAKTLGVMGFTFALSTVVSAAPVDSELVILVDGQTFSQTGFDLILEGVAQAFEQQSFIDSVASGPYGKIASSVMVFNAGGTTTAIPWMEMSSATDLQNFANAVRNVTAPFSFGGISYVDAITSGAASIANNAFEGSLTQMTMIEDGNFFLFTDSGAQVQAARDAALANGVDVINSVIFDAGGREAAIQNYYDNNVVSGGSGGEATVIGNDPFAARGPVVTAAIEGGIASTVVEPTQLAAVPEPSVALLVSLCGFGLLARRRR